MLRKIVLCGLVLLSAGCHKKAPVVQVPLVLPAPAPEPVATIATPVPVPDTTPPPVQSPVAISPALPPPVTPPPPSKPKPSRPAARVNPGTEQPVAPAPLPAPSLGAILSADERKRLDAEYRADLRQANKALSAIRGHSLTPSQLEDVTRARDSISQAAQYHDRDLATAAELARRARVLTQDLAGAR